ncbi:MAG TPA: NAD(P)H-quinone oxidoreductase [Acetobacteraceae bacterium]|nr:NAD(P)H-quinone oxidoreductase [Acetobacteraceae bacterium]
MTQPHSMTFIAVPEPGGPEAMRPETGPVPSPAPDEVLIRVQVAGVNRPDVVQRKGLYPPPPDASPVLGLEVAGEVVATGAAVTAWKVGDRVCALTNGGGYAEYCVAPETQCLPWPEGYDALRAAALPETYFTVWANLFRLGRLVPGERALVHGGTGGIGVTAIQLAHEFGATVFTTAGSAEKCAACLRFGADHAINYREADFLQSIQEITGKEGVDVILDVIGAAYFARNLRVLKRDGRLVIIALQGGTKVDGFDLTPVMVRRLTITGSTLRARSPAQKAEIARDLHAKVWPVLDAGRCGPVIHATFPLAEAARAHALMEEGSHIGKIMLTVG